jgi:7,8-dihydropterin-6-yl-methyl-4-(beta-D-ribofuranosyl)aminobenzene 5'-phosphate synthase
MCLACRETGVGSWSRTRSQGSAADPIALEPVDDVVVTTLVDNVYDALLTGDDSITRAPFAARFG